MLISTEPTLEQITLRLLAAEPHLTAKRIRAIAVQKKGRFSQAAVYKVLHRLLANGVIVKAGSRYSLSLGWVFELLTFADRVSKTYFSESYVGTLMPAPGKRLSWKFSDLTRCNEFWNQLLLALLKHTEADDVFSWVPYAWFAILQDDRESRLHQAFKMSGRRFYTNFGAAGSLEPAIQALYNHKNQTISFARGPLAEVRNSYIDIVGDFVLTVALAPDAARRIHSLFNNSLSRRSANPAKQLAALSQDCRITVMLERSPKKASRLRKQLSDFFGA